MKIDIQIDDYRKYATVAFLIDRDDFLKDIEIVRKRIGLSKTPYIFPSYQYSEANRIVAFYKNGQISINGVRELLEEFCREEKLQNLYALDKILGTAVLFAESLTKKYNKNRLYTPVILASILVACIKEDDFLSTQMYEINRKAVQDELSLLDEDEEIVTIRVNRESTVKEVQQTFDFIQKYYFKTKKSKNNDGLKSIYANIPDKKVLDTAKNIKRDRGWYWMYQNEKENGKGAYKRIVEKWEKTHPPKDENSLIDQNKVEQAVSRYRKFLNADI